MKQCPQCGRTFTADNQFCLEDGTVLMSAEAMPTRSYSGDIPTVVVPKIPPTQHFGNQPQFNAPPQFQVPPSPQTPPNQGGKWIYPMLGLLLGAVFVLGGLVVYQFTKERVSTETNQANKETPKSSEKPTQPPTPQPTREVQSAIAGKYPEGSTRLLNENDIAGKSSWDLRIMRNEIFARHGRRFKNPELRNYFISQSWYNPQFDEVQLSEIEKRNVEFLKSYE